MSESLTTPRSDTLPPDAISDVLLPVVEELGLLGNCRQLAAEGWTVIENAADPEFVARLRKGILADGTSFMRLDKDPVYAKRLERLRAAGLSEGQLARIRTPIGLDIGARQPEEIALAIMAEIIAAKNGALSDGGAG